MNQEPIAVKLLTQSKPVQYLFIAFSIILVIWAIKKMFAHKEITDGIKSTLEN